MIPGLLLTLLLQAPVERIPTAPPEIAAQLYLRWAGSASLTPDRLKRIDMLEQAFRLAGQAAQPYPVRIATSVAPPHSEAGQRFESVQMRLDGLGLQVRAVMTMMSIHPRRALEMTLEMPLPDPTRPSCADTTVANVGEYYGLALMMAQRGFTTKERADGRHIDFLTRVVMGSTTPEQLEPAITIVRHFNGSAEEKSALVNALAAAFAATSSNSRSFQGSTGLEEELIALLINLRASEQGVLPLLDAYRQYLLRQLNGEICADVPRDRGVAEFNTRVRRAAGLEKETPGIDDRTVKPKVSSIRAKNFVFWEEGESREIQAEIAKLRPAPEKTDADWESRFVTVLHRIESWQQEDGVPGLAYFHMRALAFQELTETARKEPLLDAAISSYCQFLRDSPYKQQNPAEWTLRFKRLTLPIGPMGDKSLAIFKREVRRGGDGLMNLLLDAGETW